MSSTAQLDPQYLLWLDLYPDLKVLPALLRELIAQEAPEGPAGASQGNDLSPVLERLSEALEGLSGQASPTVDTQGLEERLDALLEQAKKGGKVPAGMFSSTGGRAAAIVDDHGNTAQIRNSAAVGDEYALLVRIIGSIGSLDVTDRAARLLGHVNVDNFPATQPVSGSVSVSNLPATQPVSGSVSVSNLPPVQQIRDDGDTAVRAGRLFLGGSGTQTLTAAGNIRLAFQNPTGSGKTAYVYRLSGGGSALAYAHLYVNPTTGVPTAARPLNNLYFGNPTPAVCKLFADQNLTTALGGGTDSGIDIVFGANVDTTFNEYPIIIPPGVTLGINVPFTGSGSGSFNIYWEEV